MHGKEYLKLMAEWMEFSRIRKSGQFVIDFEQVRPSSADDGMVAMVCRKTRSV